MEIYVENSTETALSQLVRNEVEIFDKNIKLQSLYVILKGNFHIVFLISNIIENNL